MKCVNQVLLLVVFAAVFVGCKADSTSSSDTPASSVVTNPGGDDNGATPLTYDVTVRRTSFGVPHINAADYGSMGFGYGYVHAEDNLCVLLEDLITIRGERARYFGRSGDNYLIVANGANASPIDSDFFWKLLATDEAIANLKADIVPEATAATKGFAEGFNLYLSEIKAGQHPGRHAACRGEDWLLEISEDDMYRRYFRLGLLASSSVFVNEIANAQPPSSSNVPLPVSASAILDLPGDSLPFPLGGDLDIGSNMYALGPKATATGRSMLFGNPHFPWTGTERLYLSHLNVGDTEIMGASLYGVPAVLIGFNDKFAWSHTVSTAYRFGFYELTLNPADPTQYLYDGEYLQMEAVPITITVKEDDGSLTEESRTLHRSHYGPMLEFAVEDVTIFEWSYAKAYTLRDVNAENTRLINQFFKWNSAKSLEEFIELHASVLGVPWVNTTATGPGKNAYYGDVTVVPHVTDEQARQCSTSPLALAFEQLAPGLPLLDGSRADCEFGTDADAPVPGIFGRANLPVLEREDWVHNCNDSYWATHPAELLTGFAKIIGAENTERSLRTRLCMQQIINELNVGATGDAETTASITPFTHDRLKEAVLSSAVLSEQLARDAVLADYCPGGTLLGSAGPVDISSACAVLTAWDGNNNLDSVGGHIWREFWRGASRADLLWTTPYSGSPLATGDPVNTPSGLATFNPQVQRAFADAVTRIESSPFDLDTPLRQIQFSGIHPETSTEDRIPIFGGEGFEGSFTIISAGSLKDSGYNVTFGNSYIQTVTWDQNDQPIADAFVTYSQSTDPASPYFRDMTEAYSRKEWIRLPYQEADIAADTQQTYVFKIE